ncbi:MAG: ATP synthase F1 subunit gamma [Alphaproteobacteria bacterium]|nr:MAG: ATP synthase F1 subunit gamma [Alphaproteobacteria bacterium]
MANLKDLRNRIASVRATCKITSAMKMVAASKLRRAQTQAENARPYAESLQDMLASVSQGIPAHDDSLPAWARASGNKSPALVVLTSDRGLCGGFNASVVRDVRHRVDELEKQGTPPILICIGRRGRDMLKRTHSKYIVHSMDFGRTPSYAVAQDLAETLVKLFTQSKLDSCDLMFNAFKNALQQELRMRRIMPAPMDPPEEAAAKPTVWRIYEPGRNEILAGLLPLNMKTQIYLAMVESMAGEHAARMTAMDSATRNASEMIDRLNLRYNRLRQAAITTEMIEIVSGSEAM